MKSAHRASAGCRWPGYATFGRASMRYSVCWVSLFRIKVLSRRKASVDGSGGRSFLVSAPVPCSLDRGSSPLSGPALETAADASLPKPPFLVVGAS